MNKGKEVVFFFFLFFFSLFGIVINLIRFWPDGKLHLTFCDVGQGDAIYVRFPDTSDMLIDGGPKNHQLLGCLSSAMPFYDRQIDVVILTHPQADHLGGLIEVFNRYQVDYFVTSPVGNTTKGYQQLISLLEEKKIQLKNLYSGDQIRLGNSTVNILWPQKEWTVSSLPQAKCSFHNGVCFGKSLTEVISPAEVEVVSQIIDDGVVLAASTELNLNQYSVVTWLSYGEFDALLTGDLEATRQQQMLLTETAGRAISKYFIEVLKVPHHGSRASLSPYLLDILAPRLAVISVGKDNRYGHPAVEILRLLESRKIPILRTDERGTIKIVSDGVGWSVE